MEQGSCFNQVTPRSVFFDRRNSERFFFTDEVVPTIWMQFVTTHHRFPPPLRPAKY
jgi:hypothetical protein